MGINFQRLLIVTAFNYILKRSLKELDFYLIQRDFIRYNTIYSCKKCHKGFSSSFVLLQNEIECPFCSSRNFTIKEPDVMEDNFYYGYNKKE